MTTDLITSAYSNNEITISKELIFLIYFFLINMVGAALVLVDKKRARYRQWRIPKRNFFIFAFLGAGVGEFISMILVRHKTKRRFFMIGIPVITIVFYWAIFYFMYL